jgi:hypothetical protein
MAKIEIRLLIVFELSCAERFSIENQRIKSEELTVQIVDQKLTDRVEDQSIDKQIKVEEISSIFEMCTLYFR